MELPTTDAGAGGGVKERMVERWGCEGLYARIASGAGAGAGVEVESEEGGVGPGGKW